MYSISVRLFGQFVNQLPEYKEGDTQEDMNRKVLEAIGNNKMGMVSLGGFGGYIVVGFDHTIENKSGFMQTSVYWETRFMPTEHRLWK